MAGAHLPLLLATIAANRTIPIVLAAGLVTLFVLLAILVWTRFGQARPISKCIVLSILAHLLLVIYACSTHVLYGPPGVWYGQTVMVRLHDAADNEEAAPHTSPDPESWQQAGEENTNLADHGPTEAAIEDTLARSASEGLPDDSIATKDPTTPPTPAPSPSALSAPPRDQSASVPPPDPTPTADAEKPKILSDSDLPPAGPAPQLTDLLPNRENQSPQSEPPAIAASEPAPDTSPKTTDQLISTTTSAAPPLAPTPRHLGDGQDVPELLRARVAADRLKAAQPFGATPSSEAAVAAALNWLALAQSADGRWDADAYGAGKENRTLDVDRQGAGARADTGITGLALLAFLGAGETHLAGDHAKNVQLGLEFLLGSQAADGNLCGQAELFAAMYSHGIATLALSEAYALSGDERLLPYLRKALHYTIDAQHPGGGWRYRPYDSGDMSQFGWQLMALKSAELGGIPIPPSTRTKMTLFLRSCSLGRSRGLASYRPAERASRTMTAEALVCRYFLAAENSPAASDEAAAYVMAERPGQGKTNFYYWYYGTLAMFQRQGNEWPRWNESLQEQLLTRQRWDGDAAGSWDPDDLWGCYGGRVFSTALGALSLEVYYRYLPLYADHQGTLRFTDRPTSPAMPR